MKSNTYDARRLNTGMYKTQKEIEQMDPLDIDDILNTPSRDDIRKDQLGVDLDVGDSTSLPTDELTKYLGWLPDEYDVIISPEPHPMAQVPDHESMGAWSQVERVA